LAQFASAAWQLWSARVAAEAMKAELEEKMIELERLHDMVVGHEIKMMGLEKQNKALQISLENLHATTSSLIVLNRSNRSCSAPPNPG
jgi:hypothetical protein